MLKLENNEVMSLLKYAIPLLFWVSSFAWNSSKLYLFFGVLEILLIFGITELIIRKHRYIAYCFNSFFLFLINVQIICLYFGRSFLSYVMITNVDSIEDLSGNAIKYICGVIVVIVCSFIPINSLNELIKINIQQLISIVLALELMLTMVLGNGNSPIWGYVNLASSIKNAVNLAKNPTESKLSADNFHSDSIVSYIDKPNILSDNPNIIMIFVEGLSQNIIDDSRDIMTNVRYYQNLGVSFDNYYNHTFATYRGIEGTLFSGYQLNNYDANGLISFQSIMQDKGYYTEFINAEPNNRRFESYLENLDFDEVINDTSSVSGSVESLSDKESYELLFEEAENLYNNYSNFMLVIYTFGTHLSLDSTDEKYGDGSNTLLNKFYDADYQFNDFMNKFNSSQLSDNTIIIFTSDHATYRDSQYEETFKDYQRDVTDLDEIPFFIYYKGIEAQIVDAAGRNSLNLVPTVLDYLDITAENYFLGVSLFSDKENNTNYDTIFYDTTIIASSDDGNITSITDNEYTIMMEKLSEYFNAMQYDAR